MTMRRLTTVFLAALLLVPMALEAGKGQGK